MRDDWMSHLLWLALREMELTVKVMDQNSEEWWQLGQLMEVADQLTILQHAYDNRGDANVSVEFFVQSE